jgi:hypothetical protein
MLAPLLLDVLGPSWRLGLRSGRPDCALYLFRASGHGGQWVARSRELLRRLLPVAKRRLQPVWSRGAPGSKPGPRRACPHRRRVEQVGRPGRAARPQPLQELAPRYHAVRAPAHAIT